MHNGTVILERLARGVAAGLLAIALAACGGGGGSGGTSLSGTGSTTTTTGTTTGTTTTTTTAPAMSIAIVDASGTAIASNSISSSAAYVRIVLTDANSAVVPSKLVTLTTDNTVATLAQASALTDTSGVAMVRITPVSSTASAAGTVTASATVSGTAVQATVDYQSAAASVSFTSFTPSPTSITALQSAAVTLKALVGSTAAASGQVSVTFSASCGTFSPSTASSASDGTVSTVYQSLATCSGPVTLTAQSGSAIAATTVTVAAAQPANLLFTSTNQTTIFTSRASSGVKQATLKFQVVDSSGAGMASQAVSFSLSSSAISSGVTFTTAATSAAQLVSTDSGGFASIAISSGSLPTPVIVTATLVSNTAMQASSSTLAVTSGVPTQSAASLAPVTLAPEAFSIDGVTDSFTFRISDRQGNPVPTGTAVTFVASAGLITGSCTLDSSSSCIVTYTSQGVRPTNGRVVVLAYVDGEENFVDLNGNNSYDTGETFTDIGTTYRDDNEDGVHESTEQTYPGGSVGTSTCVSTRVDTPFVANTCDGVWSSSIRVRRQATVVMATGRSSITLYSSTATKRQFLISDLNGNSPATGSTVAATSSSTTCLITGGATGTIGNSTAPTLYAVALNGDSTCTAAVVQITVTSPSGIGSSYP